MSILIVEDDENKRSQLVEFISTHFKGIKIRIAKSFHSGLKAVMSDNPDVILLDMTMPTYDIGIDEDGGRPQHYAGREILRQMDRRKLQIPTWVVTGFDYFGEGDSYMSREQLEEQLHLDHSQTYKGTIYFNAVMDSWKSELHTALNLIFRETRND